MVTLRYDPTIVAHYPSVVGGVIMVRGLANGPTPAALRDAYVAEQRAALERIGATPLSEIPALAAWRSAFRAFGVDPTQYRSAAEALLRRDHLRGQHARPGDRERDLEASDDTGQRARQYHVLHHRNHTKIAAIKTHKKIGAIKSHSKVSLKHTSHSATKRG